MLDYKISIPTSYSFLRCYTSLIQELDTAGDNVESIHELSLYLAELALLSPASLKFPSSLLAACSWSVARSVLATSSVRRNNISSSTIMDEPAVALVS